MKEISDNFTIIHRVFSVGAALVGFGIAFDKLTGHVNRQNWGEERSAFLVVIGVSVTVLLRRLLPLGSVMWDFFAFACSGLPMIWGQYSRFEARKQGAIRRHLKC